MRVCGIGQSDQLWVLGAPDALVETEEAYAEVAEEQMPHFIYFFAEIVIGEDGVELEPVEV